MLGFGTSGYSWYETDQVDYLVFDTGNETRYATIINGRMIYLFVKSSGTAATDADKKMLQEFADRTVWDLSKN